MADRTILRASADLYSGYRLMCVYGFAAGGITEEGAGMLPLDIDPKVASALRHRNRATREELLRVPGLGRKTVDRILASRRYRTIRADDLLRLRVPLEHAAPFLDLPDRSDARRLLDRLDLRSRLAGSGGQLELEL
ncbi:hypothetical protein STAQ_45700 [Allostella sp. ATCC 35155]|nr:hypothetical protein STAQ_45700 [Stella sp. ATCC 35155]